LTWRHTSELRGVIGAEREGGDHLEADVAARNASSSSGASLREAQALPDMPFGGPKRVATVSIG